MKYIPYNLAVFKMLYVGAVYVDLKPVVFSCVEGATGSLRKEAL